MIITRKPLAFGEVSEKLPSKITCKICVEKTQEQLKHREKVWHLLIWQKQFDGGLLLN